MSAAVFAAAVGMGVTCEGGLKETGKAAKFWFVALGRKLERGATMCSPKAHGICGQ